jgi:hypothetical protein
MVSLVLLSQCTVDQKIRILYDLFDFADGSSDCMKPSQIYQLISTVYNRSQYYMP